MKLQDYLTQHQVSFEVVPHPDTFDAQHLAQAVHVPGRNVAKGVLLRVNHPYRYVLAVLPATHRVDLDELPRNSTGRTFNWLPRWRFSIIARIVSSAPFRRWVRDTGSKLSSKNR